MRVLIVTLAVATAALAGAPSIRWIDRTGGVRAAEVARTLEESGGMVEVELKGARGTEPKVLKLPIADLLEFVREDPGVAEQKQLLESRMAVRAGLDFDRARPILDRLAAKATAPWMRDYAAAARAVLARKSGEKDAEKRIDAFLKDFPESRFVGEVIIERAWIVAASREHATDQVEAFGDAFKEIRRRKGPHFVAYRCVPLGAALNARVNAYPMVAMRRATLGTLEDEHADAPMTEMTVRYTARLTFDTAVFATGWRRAIEADIDATPFLKSIGALVDNDSLMLGEVRVDGRVELAALAVAIGKPELARTYLLAAKEIPAGVARRMRIDHELSQLPPAREKR